MKRIVLSASLIGLASALAAAPLNIVDVGAPGINCVFNTNCTSIVTDTSSPILLPNTTGTGFLQTRTTLGATGSLAAGLTAYFYRIDLTGVTANSNAQPCLTNVVRCTTNTTVTTSNVLTCQTNQLPGSNRLVCVTNRIPGTNIVFRFTNTIPATNFVNCAVLGGTFICVTNFFPGTNIVFSFTNQVPGSNVVTCSNVFVPSTNVVVCATNRFLQTNVVVRCTTNRVSCPGTAPCIDTLHLRFGALADLSLIGTNGATGQVFVVTSGGVGSTGPTSAEQSNGIVTLHFETPICPGESSFFIGLIASNPPVASPAVVGLTSDSNLVVQARTPGLRGVPIPCDFTALRTAIQQLALSDILAPNDHARAGHRNALLNNAEEAAAAAQRGDLEAVLEALQMIANKTGSHGKPWVKPAGALPIRAALDALLDCLEGLGAGENGEDRPGLSHSKPQSQGHGPND